jgi:flagellar biosynthesis chaperone FliJ
MKKHAWRLQRVLDVKVKQEEAKKAELLEVTHRLLAARQEVIVKQAMMRSILMELSRKEARARLAEQPTVVKHMAFSEEELKAMRAKVEQIEVERRKKTDEMMEVRKSRKALEKLEEKARAEYVKTVNVIEQKELDELSSGRFVRSRLQR